MSQLNDPGMENVDLQTSPYGYSAVGLDALGASEYTLVSIVRDRSGCVAAFAGELEAATQAIVKACRYSPRAEYLLIRLADFSDAVDEVHGFKLLESCQPGSNQGKLRPNGSTALFDATQNALEATLDYAGRLAAGSFGANAILFILTDGEDNVSSLTPAAVRKTLAEAMRGEALESVVTVLIGVNVRDRAAKSALAHFHREAGLTQYVDAGDATPQRLAQVADFISRSISAQSFALGSGGASRSLTF
jgi:hypothetical protein